MISLDNVSWNPRCAPEVERPKLDREYQLMWRKMTNPNLIWVLIYKKDQIISLFQLRNKLEKKSSEEHRYTLLPGNTQLDSENKFMPLPDQTQKNSEDSPPSTHTKKVERKLSEYHRYTPLPGKT